MLIFVLKSKDYDDFLYNSTQNKDDKKIDFLHKVHIHTCASVHTRTHMHTK